MPKPPEKPVILKEIEFDFIKSNYFRVVRADGFFGGLTPQSGSIHMGVFSERLPYPQATFHEVTAGAVGAEVRDKRKSRTGIVREIEVGITMDIVHVLSLRQWLDEKIEQYTQLVGPLPALPPRVPPKDVPPKANKNGASK